MTSEQNLNEKIPTVEFLDSYGDGESKKILLEQSDDSRGGVSV